MCVRLCLASILFHVSILKNLSTNTMCHSDLLVIILNQKNLYSIHLQSNPSLFGLCTLQSKLLTMACTNEHPHPHLWKPSSPLTLPWSQWPPFSSLDVLHLVLISGTSHTLCQAVCMAPISANVHSYLLINYATIKCHLLCEAFQGTPV